MCTNSFGLCSGEFDALLVLGFKGEERFGAELARMRPEGERAEGLGERGCETQLEMLRPRICSVVSMFVVVLPLVLGSASASSEISPSPPSTDGEKGAMRMGLIVNSHSLSISFAFSLAESDL